MKTATALGTARYASRKIEEGMPSSAFRLLGRTGLTNSIVGFGCYRISQESPTHRASLELALGRGCNLIDTSTNYTDGSSERVVGDVLREGIRQGSMARDEIIVVSKVGYVQGSNLELAMRKEREGSPYPEMVKYADGCWHCIHPEFISDQLGRSLERLGLETLDSYLLHNPEYFFSDAHHREDGTPLALLREQFYDRIRRAFERLEDEVGKGRIAHYGVSSNTFGGRPGTFEMTSMTQMLEIARDIAGHRHGDPTRHHFSVVQLPMNFFESDPMLEKNNGQDRQETALEFALEKELGLLVNRPLNSFFKGQLLRLADFGDEHAGAKEISQAISHQVNYFLPESLTGQSLSRRAIAVLANTAGVSCVLNGMRRQEYVDDAMGVLELEPFEVKPALFESFRAV